ncbi:MAG TPA: MarR family transcriptional regulator [Streptomyces sp.]|uniref:GbsR/MarR family transcriptional regulator n=1 Tax=Streptomyces sp. TaxID=1931 RepID=UPI002D47410D|nr:MarR family transcriptional regulator [Streptomyces sp.]HZG04134.1 MarR family transcriptional regulator [Streptomyces sp.]
MSAMSDTVAARDAAIAQFVERFALSLSAFAFPRMAARVFVAILISEEGRLTSRELADNLKVSLAAVSQAVQYLQQVGLISKDREPGQRHDNYRLHDEGWYEMFARRDEAFLQMEDLLSTGAEALGPDSAGARRLDETRRFMEFIRVEVADMLRRWQEANGR